MPLFLSDEDFDRCSHDVSLVAQKADAYIRDLHNQLETVKAQSDAASITAEQTCSLLEQKFVTLSSEFSNLQSQHGQLNTVLEQRLSELAQLQADKHQIHLQSIGKDGEIERLSLEASELHKSKRQLIEMLEHKDSEISEKNASIKSYLDKIVTLTDSTSVRESRLSELEAELARARASSARLSQEKEIIERHNAWLNEELTSKVDSLMDLRKVHNELEADLSSKLADIERKYNDNFNSLKWKNDRVRELETKLSSLQEELCSSKDEAAATEERFSAEVATISKLVDLYKESSEEWSKKAGELEGVVKALETHASQLENDYKERLEKEISLRKELEKEAVELKQKLEKCEADLEHSRKADENNLLSLSSFNTKALGDPVHASEMDEDSRQLVPSIPVGVSGTALAVSLLRDGWSLAKMYTKYQEAVDALRHEQLGRKQSQAILERVLYEIEEKAGVIMDERAEHERMAEAYSAVNQKLQYSLSEQSALERTIQELKADLRRHERDYSVARKEIVDLEKQVTVLLKECRDVQLRCGYVDSKYADGGSNLPVVQLNAGSDGDDIISERLLTFKDINGLVEQNVQLRSLVRSLSEQVDNREVELKVEFEKELDKHSYEAASKVDAVLARAEEQGRMIESLHTSVAMYKKLYEEEQKLRSSYASSREMAPEEGRKEVMFLLEGPQEAAKKAQEQVSERVKFLEEELTKLRAEIITLRSQRDKLAIEANFAQEKLDRFMKEFEHQREETNGVAARNVEFSQLIIDYQRKMRESSESVHAAEDLSRKLTMEVSVLKHEKELLLNSEKRATEEVRSLSERVYRLQATLDTIQSAAEVREEARSAERRKQEDYVKQIEREWAEAKKELQEERNNVRSLTQDRDNTMKGAMRQLEEMGKELASALRAASDADSRAAVAEARYSDLEKAKNSELKVSERDGESLISSSSNNDVLAELRAAKEEVEKFREEAQVNKDHMLHYKSIAQVNETALKQMEVSHENFKDEADKVKKSLEAEILSLKERVHELESECSIKTSEAASAAAGQEEALASSLSEIASLREENSVQISTIAALESQISAMKDDSEKEHQRWRTAQDNYERQVILQSETIQELTKTSQALASLQEEASELRRSADSLKLENKELKAKWETEKSVLEESKVNSDKKYNEINEQNKILHSRLEALHIKLAEKDRKSGGTSSESNTRDLPDDAGLQNVVNYLRRSKEIAETEISLLRQEKFRLQSQLENALKAAETAQGSLRDERANSRATLFTEEEFKALQIQIREMNLLRESNIQLREENRHNFEECQKLRQSAQEAGTRIEKLETVLSHRQTELEACKREIDLQKTERERLEKRVEELLRRGKDIDPEDYNRMREDVQQMQVNLRDKDGHLEEIKKLLSEKQHVISQLEQDLARIRTEVSERESRITDVTRAEGTLKLDIERQRKFISQLKRKSDNLVKEKEELIKGNQALSKELEESNQGKKNTGDADQVLREREKEKDTKIHMLEKMVERLRDDLKKEKDELNREKVNRGKTEKILSNSFASVKQQRSKLEADLEKQKQVLKALSDEVEKLKRGSQSEGAAAVHVPPGGLLDELAAPYLQSVQNFEKVAQQVSTEYGTPTPSAASASSAGAPSAATASAAASEEIVPSQPMLVPVVPAASLAQGRGKKLVLPKPNVETRKSGRRLVRPRIKPEEPQGDTEMLETEAADGGAKVASSSNNESQATIVLPAESANRKRPSALSASDVQEESPFPQESSDVGAPNLKKSRVTELPLDGSEVQPAAVHVDAPEVLPSITEESLGHIEDETSHAKEEAVDAERDEEGETGDEQPGDPLVLQNNRNNPGEESLGIPNEAVVSEDQPMMVESEQEMMQQPTPESGSEREEGELDPDVTPDAMDGAFGSQENEEAQPDDHFVSSPSPARFDEAATMDHQGEMEISSPHVGQDDGEGDGDGDGDDDGDGDGDGDGDDEGDDDKIDEGDIVVDEIISVSSSDKLTNDGNSSNVILADTAGVRQEDAVAGTSTDLLPKAVASIAVIPSSDRTTSSSVSAAAVVVPSGERTTSASSGPAALVVPTVERTTSANAAAVEVNVSRQESSTTTLTAADTTEAKQDDSVASSSTTINLNERARQRAILRQAGNASSRVERESEIPKPPEASNAPSPPVTRGRGRVTRGRGARAGRGGAGRGGAYQGK